MKRHTLKFLVKEFSIIVLFLLMLSLVAILLNMTSLSIILQGPLGLALILLLVCLAIFIHIRIVRKNPDEYTEQELREIEEYGKRIIVVPGIIVPVVMQRDDAISIYGGLLKIFAVSAVLTVVYVFIYKYTGLDVLSSYRAYLWLFYIAIILWVGVKGLIMHVKINQYYALRLKGPSAHGGMEREPKESP